MPAKKESDSSPVKKGARKAKSADDKPKVKRAPSAYIVFCTEKRTEAKESNPDATFGELGKILGLMWGQLDDKGKEVRDFERIPIVVNRPTYSGSLLDWWMSEIPLQSNHTAILKDLSRQESSPRGSLRSAERMSKPLYFEFNCGVIAPRKFLYFIIFNFLSKECMRCIPWAEIQMFSSAMTITVMDSLNWCVLFC